MQLIWFRHNCADQLAVIYTTWWMKKRRILLKLLWSLFDFKLGYMTLMRDSNIILLSEQPSTSSGVLGRGTSDQVPFG